MSDRDISDLNFNLQPLAREVLAQGNAALKWHGPSTVKIIVTWRSAAEQNAAKAAGLSKDAAGDSPHNCVDEDGNPASCAFDFGIFDAQGKYIANGQDPRYAIIGKTAEALGLEWGGSWGKWKDWDHIELKDWNKT